MLIPASMATSSRRRPLTRRLPPYAGSPASSGVSLARREARNFRTSSLFVMAPTLRRTDPPREGLPVPGRTGTPPDARITVAWKAAQQQRQTADGGTHLPARTRPVGHFRKGVLAAPPTNPRIPIP